MFKTKQFLLSSLLLLTSITVGSSIQNKSTSFSQPVRQMIVANAWTEKGTEADPYLIHTAADLMKLATSLKNKEEKTGYQGKYFQLANNIFLNEKFISIGDETNAFKGNFNGNNYSIANMNINEYSSNMGLFGVIGTEGKVANLFVEGISKVGDIENYVVAPKNTTTIGGIAGKLSGEIENCSSDIRVESYVSFTSTIYVHIGGIVGENAPSGKILNCTGAAEVISYAKNTQTTVAIGDCSHNVVGGIVGLNEGHIEKSDSTANEVYAETESKNTGASVYLGGIIGQQDYNTSLTLNCYSATVRLDGKISAVANAQEAAKRIGGIVGSHFGGRIENCQSAFNEVRGAGSGSISNIQGGVIKAVVTFVANANHLYFPRQIVSLNDKITQPVLPENVALDFLGWYKNQYLTCEKWNFETDVMTESLILYGKWKGVPYVTTIVLDDGTSVQAMIDEKGKISEIETPEKEGYTFDGFYKDSNKTVRWNFETDLYQEGMTLYVKWTSSVTPNPAPTPGMNIGMLIPIIVLVVILVLILASVGLYLAWEFKDFVLIGVLTPLFRKITKIIFKTELNKVEEKNNMQQ